MFVATCIAPVNIALIKYWGKRNEELILPINDSLSMTLSTDEMCAKTTVATSSQFKHNKMWLNGEEVPFDDNPRIARCLKKLQGLALAKGENRFPSDWKLHVASENNFPTAAGLASSAAGYACLVFTLSHLYGVEQEDLTSIARLGSGSACRSLHGGFVRWFMGSKADGSDSVARPIASYSDWPDMHVIILVVNDARKKTSSTKGMQRSVETSELIAHRATNCVPKRIDGLTEAIKQNDFAKFAEITMKDSNQFHAIALDTYPPCVYMNDVSHAIVQFVHAFNNTTESCKVAYTFDAGPNACIYVLEKDVPLLVEALQKSFPNDAGASVEYLKGIPLEDFNDRNMKNGFHFSDLPKFSKNLLKYIIHTKIGTGPQKLSKDESLLNLQDGNLIV